MKHCLQYPIIEYDTSAARTITRIKSGKTVIGELERRAKNYNHQVVTGLLPQF